MKKIFLLFVFSFFLKTFTNGQELPQPKDQLSNEFHASRRDALRKIMPEHSVAVIFAYPERVFSRDVNYPYHPSPDLYYFSGYKEPDAVLFIFKEDQHRGDRSFHEIFFARNRDSMMEQFTGKRLGAEGVRSRLGFPEVYDGTAFDSLCPDLRSLQVLTGYLPDDVEADIEPGSLYEMVAKLRSKSDLPSPAEIQLDNDLSLIAQYANTQNLSFGLDYLHIPAKMEASEAYRNNPFVRRLMNHPDSAALASIKKDIGEKGQTGQSVYRTLVASLREIKTPEELALLRKSVEISSIAHAEAMRAVRPDISEREMEGILTYVHRKYGAEEEGYPPIVGSGPNTCILHYEENSVTNVSNQLLLMDVASAYHGYSADVTRTIPSSGKFTPEQRAIYQLVYDAQEEVFKLCKEGTPFNSLNEKAKEVLSAGLIKLGIIKDKSEVSIYYPHLVSHHMGLDVHDVNNRGDLRPGMVLTVEPGIYIMANSKCDPKWWNIGVRIEDDVLIGKDGCTLLSKDAPRKAEDVEKMIAQKSLLKDFRLPALAN